MLLSTDKIIVTLVGMFGIAAVFWFFLGKKEQAVAVTDSAEIVVDGGYTPAAITIPKGKKTRVTFLRKDPSSCLEDVVLPEFKIRKSLPLNQPVTVELEPMSAGEFRFSCGMNMFHGKIIVKESV